MIIYPQKSEHCSLFLRRRKNCIISLCYFVSLDFFTSIFVPILHSFQRSHVLWYPHSVNGSVVIKLGSLQMISQSFAKVTWHDWVLTFCLKWCHNAFQRLTWLSTSIKYSICTFYVFTEILLCVTVPFWSGVILHIFVIYSAVFISSSM